MTDIKICHARYPGKVTTAPHKETRHAALTAALSLSFSMFAISSSGYSVSIASSVSCAERMQSMTAPTIW